MAFYIVLGSLYDRFYDMGAVFAFYFVYVTGRQLRHHGERILPFYSILQFHLSITKKYGTFFYFSSNAFQNCLIHVIFQCADDWNCMACRGISLVWTLYYKKCR